MFIALYEVCGKVATLLLCFYMQPVWSIYRPRHRRYRQPIVYERRAITANFVCRTHFEKFISDEYYSRVDYRDRGTMVTRLHRHRDDPIVYPVDARSSSFQAMVNNEGETPPTTSYCDHRCGDTRPKFGGNTEDFLPSYEPIENNVTEVMEELLNEGMDSPFVNVTEYVPVRELKYTSMFRILCKPGYSTKCQLRSVGRGARLANVGMIPD